MEYAVIVEQDNGIYRARIPALPNLTAEGQSRDQALHNVWQAAEDYLAKVEVATIEVAAPPQRLRPGSPKSVLAAAGKFKGDEEVMLQHIEEIYAERRRQRAEVERELDEAERRAELTEASEQAA